MTDLADRYARAEALLPANALRHAFGWLVQPRWIGGDGRFLVSASAGRDGLRFIPESNPRSTAPPGPASTTQHLPRHWHGATGAGFWTRTALPLRGIIPVGDAIRFTHGRHGALFTPPAGCGERSRAAFGPTALPAPRRPRAVILRDHNMHLLEKRTSRPLTTDGVAHTFGLGRGTRRHDGRAVRRPPHRRRRKWFPPCGRWLRCFRCDERAVREMPVQGPRARRAAGPSTHRCRVPLIGDPVTETARLLVIDTPSWHADPDRHPPFAADGKPVPGSRGQGP